MSAEKAPAKKSASKKVPAKVPASGNQELQEDTGDESSQSGTGSTQETSDDAFPLSSRRMKLVELATQLAAAQIAASASYQAAVDVATEQRDMLGEFFELLVKRAPSELSVRTEAAEMPAAQPDTAQSDTGPPDTDQPITREEFIFPDLDGLLRNAHTLFRSRVRIRKPREMDPLSHEEFDQLFASAMYRAQKLLTAPEQDRRIVWAEQLFAPEDTLSENEIFNTFERFKWPNLKSRDPVIQLMTEVDNWFSSHLRNLEQVDRVENRTREAERVRDETELLFQTLDRFDERANDGFNRHRRDYKAVADAIRCFLQSRNARVLSTLSGAFWNKRAQNLIFMIFNQSVPSPRKNKPDDGAPNSKNTKKAKAPTRNYRPWGVFRYLRLYAGKSGDEAGAAIKDKIRTRVLELNPNKVVNVRPVAPPEFEFGPIGAHMDDLLDSPEYRDTEPSDYMDEYTDDDLPF